VLDVNVVGVFLGLEARAAGDAEAEQGSIIKHASIPPA